MRKAIFFHLIILLLACNPSGNNNATNDTSKTTQEKPEGEKTVYSWANKLNIRNQPSAKGKVIASANSNDALELTETKSEKLETHVLRGVAYQDYWYKVRTADGHEGWVFGGAVKRKNEQKGNAILTKKKFDFPYFGKFDLADWTKLKKQDVSEDEEVDRSLVPFQKGDQYLEIGEWNMGDMGYGYWYSLKNNNKNGKILKEREISFSPGFDQPNTISEVVKDYTQNPPIQYSRNQKIDVSRYDLKPFPVMASGSWQIDALGANGEPINIKSLLNLSPTSIFDGTAAGINEVEKNALFQKGKSASWEIMEETETRLAIKGEGNDVVKLYFLKNKYNADGLLAVETTNGKTTAIDLWKYLSNNNGLEKSSSLKKFSANDFVSASDHLPDSYQPKLHYQFIDDQTIEVSLYTWMDKEFENREIINSIFLKWNGENFEETIVNNKQAKGIDKFNILNKSNHDLSKLNHDGKIVNKRFWRDSNGENIVLFTRKEDELYLYHYAINADKVKLLRKVYDFEKDCDFDLTLGFIEPSIKVTDLDNNNFGEITFAYKKACISDVSPKDLKLIMLENGNKYIIRGTTSIDKPGIKVDASKKVDASFNDAPASFLSHADKIWDNIKKD